MLVVGQRDPTGSLFAGSAEGPPRAAQEELKHQRWQPGAMPGCLLPSPRHSKPPDQGRQHGQPVIPVPIRHKNPRPMLDDLRKASQRR